MLHTPSYNCGLAAGIAWKAMGGEHFNISDLTEADNDTPRGKFIDEILGRSEGCFFFPSSFMEGFYNAFHTQLCFVDAASVPASK